MKQIIILQSAVLSICAAVAFAVWGFAGFLSAVGGGLSCLLPTFVAVLLLKLFRGNPFLQSRMFVFGEILKVVLSLLSMLAVFAIWHQSLVFAPFLMGLLGVSHLVFLVLLRVKDYGR
ncbi:F0F1 ATP synthase subunit I [Neisseria meningitidis]|nr:F0F1 ATP synthase subunit I [Neisseria meningitidis]MBJ7842316.1 F0F1 ATP synthase subunit I [Neisseria meningitidis]